MFAGHTEHYKKTFNENILERNAKLQNHNMKLVVSVYVHISFSLIQETFIEMWLFC